MKKLFLFTFLILSTLTSAQGNLQFNQVKLVTNTETVPVGKVWKIESVIYNIPFTASGYQSTYGQDGLKVQDGIYTYKIVYKLKTTAKHELLTGHVNLIR
jgi:hypothetical protein